jgi:ribonuclease VapC
MIVDASAILSMLLHEEDEDRFVDALSERTEDAVISPVNYLEVALRVDRGNTPELSEAVDPLLSRLEVQITKITPEQAYLARAAYQKFGNGNHEARLNLGDCFAYALSKARSEPLLFKGGDFRKTDVEAAL